MSPPHPLSGGEIHFAVVYPSVHLKKLYTQLLLYLKGEFLKHCMMPFGGRGLIRGVLLYVDLHHCASLMGHFEGVISLFD